MTRKSAVKSSDNEAPVTHGAVELPHVTVESYNLELRNKDGFIGDKANKSAFRDRIEDWRRRIRKKSDDPLGKVSADELSKKDIDGMLADKYSEAAALIHLAIDDFARDLASVICRFSDDDTWKGTERIVVGGGFKDSHAGALAIARTSILVKAEGLKIDMMPIDHHPDEAGLLGAIHLMPPWMLKGHDAILAVDIGGTNIRVGVVKLNQDQKEDFSRARVWRSELWRHADDEPKRRATIDNLVKMLEKQVNKARRAKLALAPVIGIGCPGIIAADGSIARGGQNLPGGNWESSHFNLPEALSKAIPRIGEETTFIIMHNDAVVQGLSELPRMKDVESWAALTIGTGLGNVHFSNREQ